VPSTVTPAPADLAAAPLDELRAHLARATGRGVSALGAGVGLWTVFAAVGALVPDATIRALVIVFGSGLLFPLSMLVARMLQLDYFAKGNPLGPLAGIVGAVQVLFIPLMVGATFTTPDAVPWYLAVLVGAHLLPYAWLYFSRTYLVTAIAIPVAAGVVGGLLGWSAVGAPLVTAGILLVASVSLARRNRAER